MSDSLTPKPQGRVEAARIITGWLGVIVDPGGVTEVRAMDVEQRYGRPCIESGYYRYEQLHKAAEEAARRSPISKGVYFCPNPIMPDLLARRANRMARVGDGETTGDKHILRRRWLLIDADPVRDSRISASDGEKAAALDVIRNARDFLRGRGWPEPVLADSGNGYHLLYRIDLPADDGGLVKRVLAALSQRFGSAAVSIDQAVANPARLTKLYGTYARKGDNAPELHRVHRCSRLLEVPGCADPLSVSTADVRVVPVELLEALAAEAKEEPKTSPPGPNPSANGHSGGYNHRLDVAKWLTARGVAFRVKGSPASGDRTVYLIQCPFDSTHIGGDTCIMQDPNGAMSAHCFHASCGGRGWQEFKEAIGKPDGDHYSPPMGEKKGRRSKRTKEARGRESPAAQGDGGGTTIIVNDRQLRDVTAEALDALVATNKPPRLFQRGSLLTRLRIDQGSGTPSLHLVYEHALRGRLARAADWVKLTEEGATNVAPPMDVVRDVLALDEWDRIPSLQAVIETPVFVAGGRLVIAPGYDPDSRLYYQPAKGLEIPAVPENPTDGDVREARALMLDELFGDFPFNDKPSKGGEEAGGTASRAHALAALLLPFVRPMIDGPTPFHLFDAPTEGTGKTLLVSCIAVVGTGRSVDGMAEASDDEEWRKRITAALIEGPAFVFIDNLNRILDSGALASALTAQVWKDRILGSTKTVSVPNNAVWLGSGNNVKMSRELIRRTVWCRLDARTDCPWERTAFRHKNLTRWAKENRGRLVGAALTLCQAWVAAGMPAGSETLGMFDQWAEVVGGVLQVAGVPGLLTNAKTFQAGAADRGGEWAEFISAWWAKFKGAEVGTGVLYGLAVEQNLLDSVLGEKEGRPARTRLGMALSKLRDRVIGKYRVTWLQADNTGRQRYKLEENSEGAAATEAPADADPSDGEQEFEIVG